MHVRNREDGEPPVENPGRASGGQGAHPLHRPARLRPLDQHDVTNTPLGLKRRSPGLWRRGISQGPAASHARSRRRAPPGAPGESAQAVPAPEEVSAPARAGSRARREAPPPPPPRVGGGASDVSSGKSPPFCRAVRPAPCPCRGILARRRQDTSDPSAKIRGWEGVSRKPRGAGKEEEARGWSEDRRPGCRGCSASSLVGWLVG